MCWRISSWVWIPGKGWERAWEGIRYVLLTYFEWVALLFLLVEGAGIPS
jgi:hypothetical protein